MARYEVGGRSEWSGGTKWVDEVSAVEVNVSRVEVPSGWSERLNKGEFGKVQRDVAGETFLSRLAPRMLSPTHAKCSEFSY